MIKSFFASEFRQNVTKVLSANVIAQAVALLVYPLVTRMYSPEEFGVFNVLFSMGNVFFVLSTGRYESAIVQPKSTRDAVAVFQLCMTILLAVSSFLVLIVAFFKSSILSFFSIESIGNGIYFLPLFVFLNGAGLAWCRWHNRLKLYSTLAGYQIIQTSVNSVSKVLFGWATYTNLGLIWSAFSGYLFSLGFILFSKGYKPYRKLLMVYDKKRIKKVAVQYADYPKYSLPHAFVNQLSGNLPVLMLAPYFDESKIGFYSLAMVIGFRPVNLITGSVNQVLFQKVTELYHAKKSIVPIVKELIRKGFLVFFPLFVALYFALPPAVDFLFGSGWKETAFLLQLQLPWLFASLFTATMAFIPVVFFRQKTAFIIESVGAVCRCLGLLAGIFVQDFHFSIAAFSWISALFIGLQFSWFYRLILKYEKQIA